MSQEAELTRFPFTLPPLFAEQLGYRGDRRFVAVHWEPFGDEVTVRDDRSSSTGLGDRYAWSDFFHQRQIRAWLWEHDINLGNSDEAPTHWLLIDRLTKDGFIVSSDRGRQFIQQQRLTNVE